MLNFLSLLLGPATQLALKVADLVLARQQAATDLEKAKIDEAIQQLNAQRDVILASQSSPVTRTIYWTLLAIAAIGPVAYINKIFLWDKTIGAFYGCSGRSGDLSTNCHIFNTDTLADANLWWITIAVFSFLFLTSRK